ncbi:MAG TPA: MFS transporter [Chitinophagaceae bacterium]|nr:MFS transporter [Chitinophagaceae bacterium]
MASSFFSYISTVNNRKWILAAIVVSQFFCTSLWFAGNAVIKELIIQFHLSDNAIGHLTSAVQFGFITGTLCYAILTIADRFSPSVVFFVSALVGAICNLGIIIEGQSLTSLLLLRFLTGFFLAGVYPVGMKIASDHYDKGLGKALGFLVGALVIGTALPHLLRSITQAMPWKFVLILTSALCFVGGLIMLVVVPNGPYRKISEKPDMKMIFKVFRNKKFRSASFGYFGHMWELYTFWAFVPVILSTWQNIHPAYTLNIAALSFLIIAVGGLACVFAGYVSQKNGAGKVAAWALLSSGICCLVSPIIFFISSQFLLVLFLVFWGMAVIADSPLFSTLVAQNAPVQSRGTALTIVTCIGFSITIISIQLLNLLFQSIDPRYIYLLLAAGPLLGLIALQRGKNDQ